jgi:glycerophosphoryl diester phosphodiesterase
MLAFDKARVAGADGIELDVRLDGDGTVVVFHDHELERLCGRPGTIDEIRAADRAALRVGGEPVPLLAEVLQAFELEINVEIKSDKVGRAAELVAATAKVIKDSGKGDHIVVSSFDPFVLVQMHARMEDLALAYLFHDEQPLPLRRGWVGRWTGASLFHPQHTLCTEETVKAWHTAGLPINAWTVDEKPELERLARLGVDGVFANDVTHALSVFSKL